MIPARRKSRTLEVTGEQFQELLTWLDADRNEAGIRYEAIRKKLMKFFVCRGSGNAETLADRTMDRVALLLPKIRENYKGNPANYFSGVAHKIFLESLRVEPGAEPIGGDFPSPQKPSDEEFGRSMDCLERCMGGLASGDRELVLAYYQAEGAQKIQNRQQIATSRGIGLNALRIRACRIRAVLLKCVEQCQEPSS